MYLLSKHDPCPPLDRRWLRAGHLAEHRLDLSPEDDGWVRQAVAFLSSLAACSDEAARHRLGERMPAVSQAHALRQADPPLLRWAVEAYILSGEPFDLIAKKCALLTEAVEAYEALFFSVLDRLHAATWVLCVVIGSKIQYGLTEQDLDVWWRFIGHAHGPLLLDKVIQRTLERSRPTTPELLDATLARDAEALFLDKKLLATHLLPVSPETALQVLQLAAQLGALKGSVVGNTPMQAATDSFLHGLAEPPAFHTDPEQTWLAVPVRDASASQRVGPVAG
jgi:hypothetical protein